MRGEGARVVALRPNLRGKLFVGLAHHADEHADVAAPVIHRRTLQALGRVAGILEQFPHHLDELALHWIDGACFRGRDIEQAGIELVDAADETAKTGLCLVITIAAGVKVLGVVPALGRHLGDGAAAFVEQRPEFRRRARAWIPPCKRDDGDVVHGWRLTPGRSGRRGIRMAAELAGCVRLVCGEPFGKARGRVGLEQQRLRQCPEVTLQCCDDLERHHRFEAVDAEIRMVVHRARFQLECDAQQVAHMRNQAIVAGFATPCRRGGDDHLRVVARFGFHAYINEASLRQECSPLARRGCGPVRFSRLEVGRAPPSFGESEGEGCEVAGARRLVEDQETALFEQGPAVCEAPAKVCSGMDDV